MQINSPERYFNICLKAIYVLELFFAQIYSLKYICFFYVIDFKFYMKKLFFITLLGLNCMLNQVYSQATLKYTEPTKPYAEALELIQQGSYNLAYKWLDNFIINYPLESKGASAIYLSDAKYYKAVASKFAEDPAAESLLRNFIENNAGSGKVSAAYYHLGDISFVAGNFNEALDAFKNVNINYLDANEGSKFQFQFPFAQFTLKDFKSARNGFNLLMKDSTSQYYKDAVYYSGLCSYYLKDYKNATSTFQKIEGANKYKNIVPYYLTSILAIEKKYDKVISYGESKIAQTTKYTNEMHHLIGNAYYEQKDYKNAAKHLEDYISTSNKVTQEDYYQLGYVQFQNKNYKGAIENFNKLSFLDNAMVQNAMFLLGQAYEKSGDKPNAKNAFAQASRMNYDTNTQEESSFAFCKLAYELNNTNEALLSLKKFIATYPKSKFIDEANELLADVYLNTQNYEEALSSIESMPNKSQKIQAAYQKMAYFRGVENYNDKKNVEAELYLDKSLKYPISKTIEAQAYYWKAELAHQKNNFDKSTELLNKYLSVASTSEVEGQLNLGTAYYLQGYNGYKKKDYISGQIAFSKAVSYLYKDQDFNIKQTIYPDAILRLADCNLMLKRYADAKSNYDVIIKNGLKGSDYALYEKAIIEGITGNTDEKIAGLKVLYSQYPNSLFADEALFELGNTFSNQRKIVEAQEQYLTLINKYPKSNLHASTYNRLALLYANQDKDAEALKYYTLVLDKYPKTAEANEALLSIKEIYINMGDPNGYIALAKKYQVNSVTISAQDSLIYLPAESQFSKGEYAKALKGFDNYLSQFPNGYFNAPAHFYRGECYFIDNQDANAKSDYEYILAQPDSRYSERAALRCASLNYKAKEYQKSNTQYKKLLELASTDDNKREALLGIMRTAYKSKNYNESLNHATKVLEIPQLAESFSTEAVFYRGASNFELKNYEIALKDLENTIKKIKSEPAAEAKYKLAYYQYLKKNYKECENQAFDFIDKYPSYQIWLVKTYLLLADVYYDQNDLFQSKATLQSIIDYYETDDEYLKAAKDKYNKIVNEESKNSKVIQDNNGTIMEFDNK